MTPALGEQASRLLALTCCTLGVPASWGTVAAALTSEAALYGVMTALLCAALLSAGARCLRSMVGPVRQWA